MSDPVRAYSPTSTQAEETVHAYWYVLHWIAGREIRRGEQVQPRGELVLEFW